MKKNVFLLIGFSLICFCFVACHPNDIISNEIIISQEQVNNRMLYHELRNSAFASAFSESYYKEEYQQQLEKVWKLHKNQFKHKGKRKKQKQ